MLLQSKRKYCFLLVGLLAAVGACVPTDPRCSDVQEGSLSGTVMGPMLFGLRSGASGVEVRATPLPPGDCAVAQSTRTGTAGVYRFDRLIESVRYTVTISPPDTLIVVPPEAAARMITMWRDRDTVNFQVVFAPRDTTLTLHVAGHDVPCHAVLPRRCLLVRMPDEQAYGYFYDSIEGFQWEAGYEYTLSVIRSRWPEVPTHGHWYRWRLLQIVRKQQV